jgi:hypothetical protein
MEPGKKQGGASRKFACKPGAEGLVGTNEGPVVGNGRLVVGAEGFVVGNGRPVGTNEGLVVDTEGLVVDTGRLGVDYEGRRAV